MRAFVTTAASDGLWAITFKTPSGSPASRKTSPIAHEHRGESSVAFKIAVFPAAMAYATERKPRIYAAFLLQYTLEVLLRP